MDRSNIAIHSSIMRELNILNYFKKYLFLELEARVKELDLGMWWGFNYWHWFNHWSSEHHKEQLPHTEPLSTTQSSPQAKTK